MFKAVPMTRVLIVGPKQYMEQTIDALHRMNVMHLVDFTKEEEEVKMGAPIEKASDISHKLLKLRSAYKVLELKAEETFPEKRINENEIEKNMDKLFLTLQLNISDKGESKAKIESLIKDEERRRDELRPFTSLPLKIESYRGYENIAVFAGSVKTDIEPALKRITDEYELFYSEKKTFIALFVEKKIAEVVGKMLMEHIFTEVKLPEGEGNAGEKIEVCNANIEKLRKNLERIETELSNLRKKFANDIRACEEQLLINVNKAEAPLRFATTTHTFMIEGWVPLKKLSAVKKKLDDVTDGGLYIEELEEKEEKHGAHREGEEKEEPPVALDNPKGTKEFETLVELYSTPSYKEIDPTLVLALVFPFFFGLMIGDIGYGVLLVITGVIFRTKLKKYEGFTELGWYIMIAGIFASLFGAFIFGDMFGLPFTFTGGEGHEEAVPSWSEILGVHIPLVPRIHKLESEGVIYLLVFSLLAGVLHLMLGLIFGIVNEARHNKKHAVAKVGWLMLLFGFAFVIFAKTKGTHLGHIIWGNALFFLEGNSIYILGIEFPYLALLLLIAGTVTLGVVEGIVVIEVFSLLSNIISYTRLAAIGVAKGAMATGFNTMMLPLIVSGNPAHIIVGWILLIGAHMIVFIFGSLSSGIQAIRLHYVEFFLKFYRGGGVKFAPFGATRRFTAEA